MSAVVVFLVLVAAAVAVAVVADQRRHPAPTRTGYAVPTQLSRDDFARPDAPWLLVLFSSADCSSCAAAWAAAEPLASQDVAVQDVELHDDRDLHERYAIEAVPTLVIADADGTVRATYLGSASADELRDGLSQARGTGSQP